MTGKKIKKLRIAKDMTRYRLGKLTGLKPETIKGVEEENKGFISSLETMATALDLEITFKAKHK